MTIDSGTQESGTAQLAVPDVSGMSVLDAALAYARSGWYVGPTDVNHPQAPKSPGSVLGKGWPMLTSRDESTIRSWFSRSDRGVFLHLGKSGAFCVDVDDHRHLPQDLKEMLRWSATARQSTRPEDPTRLHFVFTTPVGEEIGNSLGRFKPEGGAKWGDIRGSNGVIVVEPTPHPDGGTYSWQATGAVSSPPEGMVEGLSERTAPSRPEGPQHLETKAFSALDQLEQARIESWTNAALAGIVDELNAAHSWSVGYSDERGRGWEKLCADAARRLSQLAQAPWVPLSHDDAYDVFMNSSPTDSGWTVVHLDSKWRSQWSRALHDEVSFPVPDEVEFFGMDAGTIGDQAERYANPLISEDDPPSLKVELVKAWDKQVARDRLDAYKKLNETSAEPSWRPVDIDALLADDIEAPTPTVLACSDGDATFYPAAVHVIAAAPGRFKTFVGLMAVSEQLQAGNKALVVDGEMDSRQTVSRLLRLGVTPEDIRSNLTIVRPVADPVQSPREAEEFADLLKVGYSVAVIDPLTVMLGLRGANSNNADEVYRWFTDVAKPMADSGAAVIILDHVSKESSSAESGSLVARSSIGSQAKISAADVMFRIEDTDKLPTEGATGSIKLKVTKDRHGALGEDSEFTVFMDSSSPAIQWSVSRKSRETNEQRAQRRRVQVERAILSTLKAIPGSTVRWEAVLKANEWRSSGRDSKVAKEARDALEGIGALTVETLPDGSKTVTLSEAYLDSGPQGPSPPF